MQQQGWRLTGHSCGAARAVRVATIENVAASNAVGVQEAWLVGRDLVEVVRPVEVRSALADVANLGHEVTRKLALNGETPLVHGGVLDVGVEGADGGSE